MRTSKWGPIRGRAAANSKRISNACSRCSRASRSGCGSLPERCRAASSRWTQSAGPCWRARSFCAWTSRRWVCRRPMSSRSSRSSRRSTGRGRPFLWSSRTPTWHLRSLIAPMSCRPAGSCSPDRPPSCARASLCVTPISASSRSPRRPHSPPVAMAALARAALVLFLLLASSAAGMFVRPLLSEHHRSAQTNEFLRLIVTMLITFVALVLGLLTTSVKASFDKVGGEVTGFAIAIIQLDRLLREWGEVAEPARVLLRSYTASAIAMTWQEEPKPAGNYYLRQPSGPATAPQAENPRLGDILNHIERDIRGFNAKDEMHRRLAKDCLDQMQNLMRIRWHLIEDSESSITTPFY